MSVDNESTIRKIVTSDSFFKPWASLAHYLGYGWTGGIPTRTPLWARSSTTSESIPCWITWHCRIPSTAT
ncbi:aerolysin family beta-barrel pore-forming toxin [Chromobacterium sphagni]|uniref:aerolysin family beta-barrel pore-forming toxin n=1 Tax=Chromobacterium sphagni TaxID=1903179 RepID=UPI003B9879C0